MDEGKVIKRGSINSIMSFLCMQESLSGAAS